MKKKIIILGLACLMAFLFTGCDQILSIVTQGENGEKITKTYLSIYQEKVIDQTASINNWKASAPEKAEEVIDMENLKFTLEDKSQKVVVYGDDKGAAEMKFFEGGYQYVIYANMDK